MLLGISSKLSFVYCHVQFIFEFHVVSCISLLVVEFESIVISNFPFKFDGVEALLFLRRNFKTFFRLYTKYTNGFMNELLNANKKRVRSISFPPHERPSAFRVLQVARGNQVKQKTQTVVTARRKNRRWKPSGLWNTISYDRFWDFMLLFVFVVATSIWSPLDHLLRCLSCRRIFM